MKYNEKKFSFVLNFLTNFFNNCLLVSPGRLDIFIKYQAKIFHKTTQCNLIKKVT